jgi:hypothetical protein
MCLCAPGSPWSSRWRSCIERTRVVSAESWSSYRIAITGMAAVSLGSYHVDEYNNGIHQHDSVGIHQHKANTNSSTITLVANKIPKTATTNQIALAANKIPSTATTNLIDAVNTWRQLNPLADPLASLNEDYYHTVTNAYATIIIVGNKDSPGMESIFALQSTNWLHDAIITGGSDTGAKKQGAFRITQSQDKANETKTKSTVGAKPFSLHHSSGKMYWTENYEGLMEPDTLTSLHALKCSSQSISN